MVDLKCQPGGIYTAPGERRTVALLGTIARRLNALSRPLRSHETALFFAALLASFALVLTGISARYLRDADVVVRSLSLAQPLPPAPPPAGLFPAAAPAVHAAPRRARVLSPAPKPAPVLPASRLAGKQAISAEPACVPTDENLTNGRELTSTAAPDGHGEITIHNGTRLNAVVKLARVAPRQIRSIFVASGQEVELEHIPAGDYRVVFTLGNAWSTQSGKFCQNPRYSEFGEEFHFREIRLSDQIEFDHDRVTLNAVEGGNIPVKSLSEAEFLAER